MNSKGKSADAGDGQVETWQERSSAAQFNERLQRGLNQPF